MLKTVASSRPRSQAIAGLRREWEIGQSLAHPNVIRYLGLELVEHAAVIVMEDFQAVSLAERIPARGFAIDRFSALAIQLTRGLAAIHARRVIHRDVKPGNILIDASGQHVKFIDFGASARLDDDERMTVAPNRLEGTLAYISPEQTGRINRALDHRADLYSLGVTLYELLCGQVPFTATEALELVHCHLAKLPDAPITLRPELPEALSRVVMKLLAKAPEDRYQSARGLLHDLSRSHGAAQSQAELATFDRVSLDLDSHDRRSLAHSSEPWAGIGSSHALDLATITRASQAISSEIDLERLLARMMRIILLNAGANRGFLILQAEDDFRIEAAASSEVELDRKLGDRELAVTIVRHVLRSGEDVVLEDAYRNGRFTDDPHVVRRRLKSVLCTPIRHKNELVGALYLENQHAAAAFTEARTEILQILLSQAAISLENARYYDELEALKDELRSRADELSESKVQLESEVTERERGQAERLALEAQLRQSQKMEAIGQLAGGVAHDFNNLLTTIIGSTDVLATRDRLDREAHSKSGADEVRVIREAAERGASLTRQLLAFSRRQVLQPEIVDLDSLVERSGTILERLLGAEYQLCIRFGAPLGRVRVDPGQLEQVILNLVINARDAMESGGEVRLSTRIEKLDERRAAQPQAVKPGEWVVLSVSDTGAGMNPETIEHIFEPFFTTKGVGKGTGLGLSTVLGIVQQSEGCVSVDSTVGDGTTFEIWLPRITELASVSDTRPETEDPDPALNDGRETVLVVEDEAPVRRTVEQILLLHGYTVLTAEDGEACLELCAGHTGEIDLVLTDFVMPRLGGLDLAAKLRELQPDTKILFMSGFTDGQLDRHKVAALGGIELIEKPFRAAALLQRIRELLDRR